ncbi:membrane protein [Peptoniphilus lacrimalis DNF00528]|nr:membrane protein [Peptoniphilus lacrimalis DNF00528]
MIFSMEFKNNFAKLIAWAIVIIILTGLMIAFFPLLVEPQMTSIVESLLNSLSSAPKSILGFEEGFDITSIAEYLSLVFHYIGILIYIFAMQIGANSLSKEQGSGNISYIYSNPISKSDIVTGKLCANTIVYIIFLAIIGIATFGLLCAVKTLGINQEYISNFTTFDIIESIVRIFIGLFAGGLVFMSLGFLFSSFSQSSIHADAVSTLFILLVILFTIIGKVVGGSLLTLASFLPLEAFKPYSFISANINIAALGINLVLFIVFIILTYLVYNSKELKY